MVDNVQNGSLYQLSLHNGSDDLDDGFSGEHDRAFGNGIDITGKPEIFQIVKKVRIKNAQRSQIVQVLLFKVKLPDVLDHLLQSGADGISASAGITSVEGVKNHGLIPVLVAKIPLHHGELVEICH